MTQPIRTTAATATNRHISLRRGRDGFGWLLGLRGFPEPDRVLLLARFVMGADYSAFHHAVIAPQQCSNNSVPVMMLF